MSPTAPCQNPPQTTHLYRGCNLLCRRALEDLIHRLIRFNDRGAIMGAIMGEREVYN